MNKPTGKLLFAYNTLATMEKKLKQTEKALEYACKKLEDVIDERDHHTNRAECPRFKTGDYTPIGVCVSCEIGDGIEEYHCWINEFMEKSK